MNVDSDMRLPTMSADMEEAIERQRNLLYAPKSNEQLIMIALHHLLEAAGLKMPALQRELYDRYKEKKTQR